MSKDPYLVIERPMLTEKSVSAAALGKYTFRVAKSATKIDIKYAIQAIYPSVHVVDVNTVTVRGKSYRTVGRSASRKRPDWKKAIVTLQPGEKIEIFEGV